LTKAEKISNEPGGVVPGGCLVIKKTVQKGINRRHCQKWLKSKKKKGGPFAKNTSFIEPKKSVRHLRTTRNKTFPRGVLGRPGGSVRSKRPKRKKEVKERQ